MAKILISTDPKKKDKKPVKPLTYDAYKKGEFGDRDYKANPITAQEWKGMAEEKKKRNQEKANMNQHVYRETMIRIRRKQ